MLRKRLTGSKPKKAGLPLSVGPITDTYAPVVAKVRFLNLHLAEGQALFFDNVIEMLSDEKRWVKGSLHSADRYCIEGAINRTYHETDQIGPHVAIPLLSGQLRRALNLRHSLMRFNDHSDLSHSQMIAKLRDAALRIRRGEVALT